jgi:hypothetical protein
MLPLGLGATLERVAARATLERVMAIAALQGIVEGQAGQRVVLTAPVTAIAEVNPASGISTELCPEISIVKSQVPPRREARLISAGGPQPGQPCNGRMPRSDSMSRW